MTKSEYNKYPGHDLEDIEQVVLDAARKVLVEAADPKWCSVDPDDAEPLADSVVVSLLPFIHGRYGGRAW